MNETLLNKVIYQIYPRSFMDSNNDGIGDIQGIISKLDYIKTLEVDYIWLSPIYKSPNFDNGYDISSYFEINEEFGTMEDFHQLIEESKKRDIKIIMDLVINHTSWEHEWFKLSKDINSKYHNYYIYKDGINKSKKNIKGDVPNNWTSFFGGSAWEYDDITSKYYLHLFAKEQPDLNYDNEEVYNETVKVIKFWIDKGVSGFRCDVINLLGKTDYSNGKFKGGLTGYDKYVSTHKSHKILRRLQEEVFGPKKILTIGETVFSTVKDANIFTNKKALELDMIFSFEHMEIDAIFLKWFHRKVRFKRLINVLAKWQTEVKQNAIYFENHDQPRSISRWFKKYDERQAKLLGLLLFSLKGTTFIYQGEEIGMTNYPFSTFDEIRDIESKNVYEILTKNFKVPKKSAFKIIKKVSRDNARTPMQWENELNASFSGAEPWINVNKNLSYINVLNEINDSNSTLNFYKKLIKFKHENNILKYGDFRLNKVNNKYAIIERIYQNKVLGFIFNFTGKKTKLVLDFDILFTTNSSLKENKNFLLPYEGLVYQRKKNINDEI
ncbi:MAG: alpha-glucosidase [Acholeplasmatales bacterium]|jgi:oligo-1,6-glucosidase|nr:alpha-glucosidase [Acholeplasmatales bacterium]